MVRIRGPTDLATRSYNLIDHDMLSALFERWNTKINSFHLPIGGITSTLDDVSCQLHLPIQDGILDHTTLTKPDGGATLMVELIGSNPEEADREVEKIKGAHTNVHRSQRCTCVRKICLYSK